MKHRGEAVVTLLWLLGSLAATPPTHAQSGPSGANGGGIEERPAAAALGALPLEVAPSFPPAPFESAGRRHLVYELRLTNFGTSPITLRRIDVLGVTAPDGEAQTSAPLAGFTGSTLNGLLQVVGRPPAADAADRRVLAPGATAIAFLWVAQSAAAPRPAALRHRVVTDTADVEGGSIAVTADAPPVLGAPLAGSRWLAGNGPHNASGHRRAIVVLDGAARVAQRYAIDWVRLGRDGRTYAGDPADNRAYHAYGADVLAVADGTVETVVDGIPDNVPGLTSRAVPITLETIAGNHVALALGDGRYAIYAHLQPGSIRVAPGERVRRGQVLGLLGNSGNSTEPHLHFHVANGADVLGAEGVPYVLDEFQVVDERGGGTARRRRELPLQNVLVNFRLGGYR